MTFEQMGLDPRLIACLTAQGISEPTPIQAQAIPHATLGRDVIGLAQTGTGKTAAFGLPIADAMLRDGQRAEPRTARGLILAPTRELAGQIHATITSYLRGSALRAGLVVGGASIGGQIQRLERGTDLLVATPGRLIDLLDRKAIRLDRTRYLVLDEADQMLDLGFIHALRRIARLLPAERQTLLFSATMPKLMAEIAATFLTDPVRVEVSPPGKPADRIDQSVHFVDQAAKTDLLVDLLDRHREDLALVFTRTKHGADRLAKALARVGFAVDAIHGNKSQGRRNRALASFRDGEVRVLVATDVAARGLDIPLVRHVYNFELPDVAENYVHRIGRTARAGRAGSAVALCAPAELGGLREIEKLMGRPIETAGGVRSEPEPKGGAKPARRRPRRQPRNGSAGGRRLAA